MKRLFIVIFILFLTPFFSSVSAQETLIYSDDLKWYNNGLELFDKEKYSAAMEAFEKSQLAIQDKNSEAYVNSTYYKAVCALQLFHKDAEFQLKEFISNYPESSKVTSAYFQLGKYNYRKKKWDQVVFWFSKTDAFSLSNEELNDYNFRMGYSYFNLENYTKASAFFRELISIPSPYYEPANYYYAHIAYLEGNYETALQGFNLLREDKKFKVVIPYYVCQIYYFQEKYDTLIAYAVPFLDDEKTKRKPEISKLVGDALYQDKKYEQAVPYLEFYLKEGETHVREDYFQLGFAQMNIKNYEKSIQYFSRVTTKEDELGQKSLYNLGNCYLKLDNKSYARNAFKKASELDFIPSITEESLLNYAKLSYELDYDPYNDAITAFVDYLKKYPNGLKKNEAYSYLVNIYLSTKNYEAALASLELNKSLDPRLMEVFQQLQFNLAIEQFQNSKYSAAISSFEKSQSVAVNKSLYAQSMFWIADAHYRQNKFEIAIEEYESFIFLPRAVLLPEFKVAHYNLGYSYYQIKQYESGAKWFRKFLTYEGISPSQKYDALLRVGDCYFITKNYLLSEEFYQNAASSGGKNGDYALYQLAQTQGLLNKKDRQISSLDQLIKTYPKSPYAQGAVYELGKTYMIAGNNEKAVQEFNQIITNYSGSPYRKKSMENIGLIYYNSNQNEKALKILKQVVDEYPNYADSKSALTQIQLIYKDMGNIEAYENYLAELNFLEISDGELDSLSFFTAEDFYISANYSKAAEMFTKYLNRFENPIFEDIAQFYVADCFYQLDQLEMALPHFEYNVVSKNPSYYQSSLQRAAEISYKLGKYNESLNYFTALKSSSVTESELIEIYWWSLKSADKISDYPTVLETGDWLLMNGQSDIKRRTDIQFIMANAYRKTNNIEKALPLYREVSQNTQEEKSAASLYYIAHYLYENNQLDSCEKVIFEVAQHTPTYPDWLAKGLILLSDIYVLQEDYFQARTTLESVTNNYQGDAKIEKEAQDKLKKLTDLENSIFDNSAPAKPDEIKFNEDDSPQQNDNLFDEEELEEENIPGQNNSDKKE